MQKDAKVSSTKFGHTTGALSRTAQQGKEHKTSASARATETYCPISAQIRAPSLFKIKNQFVIQLILQTNKDS